jgi:predicted transposase YbfD/YdcC
MEAFGRALATGAGPSVLAVDGKSLKCAYEKGRAHMPPMMVSVWGTQMRMTFAQTQAGEGGEAEAAIALLQRLSLTGCVVTADAIHCSRATSAETCEDGHGRHERRSIFVVAAPGLAREHGFKGLTAVARVVSERTVDGKTTREERLFIASRRFAPFDFLDIVRKHWDIENGSHWQQDVVFHEDLSRNRQWVAKSCAPAQARSKHPQNDTGQGIYTRQTTQSGLERRVLSQRFDSCALALGVGGVGCVRLPSRTAKRAALTEPAGIS